MLVDPIFASTPDRSIFSILSAIGGNRPPTPRRISKGLYSIFHFSMGELLPRDGWAEYPEVGDYGCGGVCDSPDQFAAHPIGQWLASSERRFTVSFTCIRKAEQPQEGGWRWHKWGEYIGEKSPQCEYIYDEGEDIAEVYCFHVYECLDHTKATAEG